MKFSKTVITRVKYIYIVFKNKVLKDHFWIRKLKIKKLT